jgi:energy-coupling factor transporter ATP-binding protein EcfA2
MSDSPSIDYILNRLGMGNSRYLKSYQSTGKKSRGKRFFKYRSIGGYEMTNKAKNDIFLGASDITDYMTSNVVTKRNELMLETYRDDFGIHTSRGAWKQYSSKLTEMRSVQTQSESGYFFDDEALCYMYFSIHSTHVSISLVGSGEFIVKMHKQFADDFEFVTNQIEWIYSSDGKSIEIPLQHDKMPVAEMYPFLEGQDLGEYYDNFMQSNASILLLIGPPGTGKTTFIRGLLQHTNTSALVSYDANILEKDYVFADFIEGDKSVLVLEDADMFLKSRKEGNTMMHKFLNVGDGLVTTRNKKLVFSTNLPSISDIDPALIRPGRCYDILHFGELTQAEAKLLAEKAGVELGEEREKWSIADVFFNENTNKVKNIKTIERKMGFV